MSCVFYQHAYSPSQVTQISQHKVGQHLKETAKLLPFPAPKLETEHFKAGMNKTRNGEHRQGSGREEEDL